MMAARDRYQSDPYFRTLTDHMRALIEKADFTPTEIREAAILAQIMYEEHHIREMRIFMPNTTHPKGEDY